MRPTLISSIPGFLRVFLQCLLLMLVGGFGFGCELEESPVDGGTLPGPSPGHYRDFQHADSLAQYLRSDALPLVGAHRGGSTARYPENALATFAHSLTHGPVLLECDVRMSKDSVLVLMHDETLDRTTTGTGTVRSHTVRELRALQLVADSTFVTSYQIPTLMEALAWAEGRAVLQLDVKENVPRSLVVSALRRAEGFDQALVITYTMEDAVWYHRQVPRLLLSVSADSRREAMAYLEQISPSRLVGFVGVGEPSKGALSVFSRRNVPVAVGTFGEMDRRARRQGVAVYRQLFDQGIGIVATDETALASQAAATYVR